jgi:hypothetical protein
MKSAMRVVLLSCAMWLAACSHSNFDPPERSGPIGLVETGGGKQAWLATIQEEERSRNVGGGSRRIGRWVTEYHYHLRLQAHDPATVQRLWLKELKVLRDKEGGRNAGIRILGQQGEVVWVWVHDQVLALSARDGSLVADRSTLEQANPAIKGPGSGRAEVPYVHRRAGDHPGRCAAHAHRGARLPRHALPGRRRAPVQPGRQPGYDLEWRLRHERLRCAPRTLRRRLDRPAQRARSARCRGRCAGDHYADSADIDDERAMARRSFWRAKATAWSDDFLAYGGRKGVQGYCEDRAESAAREDDSNAFMRAAADGNLDDYENGARATAPATHRQRVRACIESFDAERFKRIVKLERIGGAGDWLQGRLLKAEAVPGAKAWIQRGILMKPAVRAPLRLEDPDSVLVLHRTRMDAQGRLALSRVDATFARTLWTAVLPYDTLANRWSVDSQLLLNGNWNEIREGVTTRHEALLSLDLADGRWEAWDIGADAPLSQATGSH